MTSPHPRLIDVARRAGVAVTTVSGILNGSPERQAQFSPASRKLVHEAAAALGYVRDGAAKRLRSGRAATVGLVMLQSLQDQAYAGVVPAVEGALRTRGMAMQLVLAGQHGGPQAVQELLGERISGIVLGAVYQAAHVESWWAAVPVPKAIFGANISVAGDVCGVDFGQALELAIGHLVAQGHRRIGLLRHWSASAAIFSRLGVHLDPGWVMGIGDITPAFEEFLGVLNAYVARWRSAPVSDRPTAILCNDDHTAKILLSLLYQAGVQVPRDVSVIGQGNVGDSEWMAPPLTTVDLRIRERAVRAVECLVARRADPELAPSTIVLPPSLVVRQSVGPPP